MAGVLGLDRLPSTIETTLYRVAQEALSNIRKHSRTNQTRLALEHQGSMIYLEVQDWGCGFDPLAVVQEVGLGEHVGLREMQERVELISGHFMISSRQGAGTMLVASVPVLSSDARSMYHE